MSHNPDALPPVLDPAHTRRPHHAPAPSPMDAAPPPWSAHSMVLTQLAGTAGGLCLLISLGACGATIQGGNESPGGGGPVAIVQPGNPPGEGGRPGAGGTDTGTGTTGTGGSGPAVLPPTGWQLAAGGDNTCVKSPSGHVACWGSNETGQLGLGDFADRWTPEWIPGLDGVVEIAVADFSMCALRADATVWCWGMNFYGELGAQTAKCPNLGYACSNVPVLAAVTGASHITAGVHQMCALKDSNGEFECWGQGASVDTTGVHVLEGAAGQHHTCVRFQPGPGDDPDRNVICDGHDDTGQLGTGSAGSGPVASGPPGGFVEIASGLDFSCAVGADQGLYCWGMNQYGSVGVGAPTVDYYPEYCPGSGSCATAPTHVGGLPPVAHVATHFGYGCALTSGGSAYCWGSPSHTSPASAGECWVGNPECSPTPEVVTGVAGAAAIAVGYGHACVMGSGGEVSCWGLDTHGQLGHGSGPVFESTPVGVSLPPEPL